MSTETAPKVKRGRGRPPKLKKPPVSPKPAKVKEKLVAKPKTQKHVNPYLISREDLRYFIRHDAIGAEKFREVLRAVNEVEKKHGSAFIYWNLDGTFTVRTRKDPEGWGPGTTVAAVPKPLAPKPPTPKPALKKPKPKPVQPKERRIKSFLKT